MYIYIHILYLYNCLYRKSYMYVYIDLYKQKDICLKIYIIR